MSILLICPNVRYQVSDCIWIQHVYALPSVKGKKGWILWQEGKKSRLKLTTAYSTWAFCTMSLSIVYNPKLFTVKMKIFFLFLFLIHKWHGYVYQKWNRVLSSASASFGLDFDSTIKIHTSLYFYTVKTLLFQFLLLLRRSWQVKHSVKP